MAPALDSACSHVIVAGDDKSRLADIFNVVYHWRLRPNVRLTGERRPRVSCCRRRRGGVCVRADPGRRSGMAAAFLLGLSLSHVHPDVAGIIILLLLRLSSTHGWPTPSREASRWTILVTGFRCRWRRDARLSQRRARAG